MTGYNGGTADDDDELVEVSFLLCRQCFDGVGGECHTPGCAFWCHPAPDDEQAAAIRRADEMGKR